MSLLSRGRWLWRNVRHREHNERLLDDELQSTLQLLVDGHVASGLSPAQAQRAALIELRIEPIKERVRDTRTGAHMETFLQDLRYAWRHIRRSPGFATAAILTLALGIGANTAMFSMLTALTDTPLAVGDPDGLLAIAPRTSRGLDRSTPVDAIAHLQDGPLESLCGYLGGIIQPVLANGAPVQVSTTFITSRCLNAFRIQPAIGRPMREDEAPIHTRGARVALISDRLWRNVFGGDSQIVGKTVQVNSVDLEIIGVLPPGFIGLEVDHGVDIFTPFDTVLLATPARRQLAGFLLGRLRPGVTIERAEVELQARWPAVLDAVLPSTLPPSELANFRDSQVRLERMRTGRSPVRDRYAQPLWLITGLTAVLLMLACVNLGGLLLARLSARRGELTVRLAIGGTRWRIAQQMLIENVALAIGGALLALPLAYGLVRLLTSLLPTSNLPNTMSFTPDLRVLATTSGVALVSGLAISALPVWLAVRRQYGNHVAWDRTIAGSTSVWGRGLLVTQVALSTVLLIGATLLTRSLYLLQHTDLGIQSENVLTVRTLPLPAVTTPTRHRLSDFNRYLERFSALPGVRAVALARLFPRATSLPGVPVHFVGDQPTDLLTRSDYVSREFFSLLKIPILAGRTFTAADEASSEPVTVVSESLARALAPDGQVVGRRIRMGPVPVDQNRLIIGVVGNATQGSPRASAPLLAYRPLQLTTETALSGNFLIATNHAASVASQIRAVFQEIGRDYIVELASVDAVIARAPASERMSATMATAVGALAVVLAFVGIYGTLAYSVSRRRREIGVRVAIGAAPRAVARAVIREGLVVTAIGVALGLPLALVAARMLEALLFGITPADPITFVAAAAFFLLLGVTAGAVPARRAARVDPLIALRAE